MPNDIQAPGELVSALEEIRKMAMDHPCFDADCFERRDIEGLCEQGGDICDWTMVAIHASDALRANAGTELPARVTTVAHNNQKDQ